MGFPTKATWIKAIQAGNYATWPLLNVENFNKHFPELDETQKGCMRQTKLGLQSTKTKELIDKNLPDQPIPKECDIMVDVFNMRELIATAQTGKLPYTSSRGSKYIMIMAEIDSNAILVATIMNQTEGEIMKAY